MIGKKIEYAIECVPRYYFQRDMMEQSPQADVLKARGAEGWELCAVGSPDCSGTRYFYFKRDIYSP